MIILADASEGLSSLEDKSITLLWTDPPFGTGEKQRSRKHSYRDYGRDEAVQMVGYMIDSALPKLSDDCTVAICMDYRAVHETKVEVEKRLQYEREIIYHFELGGISRSWWSNKHNTILLFSLGSPKFYFDAVPEIARKAPKEDRGPNRKVNSVWSITMPANDSQRVHWPNQKPISLISPFVQVHTDVNDLVVDPFAGSGTTGVAAKMLERRYAMIDISEEAVNVMRSRGLS